MPVLAATRDTQWQMPSGEFRNLYKVAVYRKADEIKRIMELLFKHGYVFTQTRRMRDYESVVKVFATGLNEWEFFKFGFDEDCKAVFGQVPYWEGNSLKNRYQTITIEEFLYEIMGHKNPESNSIVTLEQLKREFEECQRREHTERSQPQPNVVEALTNAGVIPMPVAPMFVINDGEDNERLTYEQEAEILQNLRTRSMYEGVVTFVGEGQQHSSIDHIVSTNNNVLVIDSQSDFNTTNEPLDGRNVDYAQITVADLANYRISVDAGRTEFNRQYTRMLERQMAEVDRQNDESIRQALEGTPPTVEGGSTTPSREARQRPLRTLTQRRNARRVARRAARAQGANE